MKVDFIFTHCVLNISAANRDCGDVNVAVDDDSSGRSFCAHFAHLNSDLVSKKAVISFAWPLELSIETLQKKCSQPINL